MPVNQSLSTASDFSFVSTFVVYLVALIISLFYYGRIRGIIDARRENGQPQQVREALLVTAGGSGSDTTSSRIDEAKESFHDAPDLAAQEARAEKLGGALQNLVWLGIILHIVAVVLRGLSVSRFPFGNLYEYVLVITAFAMLGAAAILVQRQEWRVIWSWLLTPILGLLFFGGTKLYADAAPVVPALKSFWYPIHVSTVSIGASIGIFSGLASLLYLLRIWQPYGKEHGFMGGIAKPLPSAKTLDFLAYRTAIFALPLFGLGIILGAIWAEQAWGRYWGWDPKETVALITWILYAAYLHARALVGWRKYWVAWINVLALGFMIFNLFFINMVVSGLHSYAGLN
ncbi:c-type cytochrome biogenesis protein CcsB [Corynebacterium sp. 3HC-13]|uniref:c-type cytochrome biogenesis protein CcsB n=1 Tax=Corynebacterium poyangense TaxID=2684405 RepID=UPI001CCE38A7|nr:c-type cytochrome biogenesis protein CcsB [Corynebacterium poyangense]MBZ8177646.1 c-type cytochrome biogenesis protein CcsB [Corynebacterium poyangense]